MGEDERAHSSGNRRQAVGRNSEPRDTEGEDVGDAEVVTMFGDGLGVQSFGNRRQTIAFEVSTTGGESDGTPGSKVGRAVCTVPGELVRPIGDLVFTEGRFPVSLVGSKVGCCETTGGVFGGEAFGEVVGKHSCGIKKQIVGFKGGDTDGIPGAKVGTSDSPIIGDFVGPTGVGLALELGMSVAFVGSGDVVGTADEGFEEVEFGGTVWAHNSGINKQIDGFNVGDTGGDNEIKPGSTEGTCVDAVVGALV